MHARLPDPLGVGELFVTYTWRTGQSHWLSETPVGLDSLLSGLCLLSEMKNTSVCSWRGLFVLFLSVPVCSFWWHSINRPVAFLHELGLNRDSGLAKQRTLPSLVNAAARGPWRQECNGRTQSSAVTAGQGMWGHIGFGLEVQFSVSLQEIPQGPGLNARLWWRTSSRSRKHKNYKLEMIANKWANGWFIHVCIFVCMYPQYT